MIRIKKPKQPPAILRTRGRQATKRLCKSYDCSPAAYKSGKKSFASRDFDSSVYGAASVKNALRRAQHDKCAFCESMTSLTSSSLSFQAFCGTTALSAMS